MIWKISKNFFFGIVAWAICNVYTFVNAQNNNYIYQYETVKMDSVFDKRADLTLETYLYYLKQEKDKKMDQVIGISKELLISSAPMSPLSNLLVDLLFEWGNNYLISKKLKKADMALLNFGGIRAALPQGKITVGDIYQISPFDNTVAFVFVKGSELKKMFDNFTIKRNAPMANVQTIYQADKIISYTIGGIPLENDKIYTLSTINFLALGGDAFLSQIHFESVIYTDIPIRDVFIEEIRKNSMQNMQIESVVDARVKILPTP